MAFFGCFPALSVLFVVLGVGRLWGPWAIIVVSPVFFVSGLWLGRTVREHPSLRPSGAPNIFFLFSWLGIPLLALWAGRTPLYFGIGGLLGLLLPKVAMSALKRYGLLDGLMNHQTCIWFVFAFSAAVPSSMSLAQLNHVMSILPIVIYGVVFGWFGPEVIARTIPGKSLPALLVGGLFFLILLLYGILETFNPALKYITPDWGIVAFVSYIACYTMLVSRCVLEAFERREG